MRSLLVLSLLIFLELPGSMPTDRASPERPATALPGSHAVIRGGAPETAPRPAARTAPVVSSVRDGSVLSVRDGSLAFAQAGGGGSPSLDRGGPAGSVAIAHEGFAGSPASARRAPAGSFRWPLDGTPTVVRAFDPPAKPWLPGHRGVDLAASVGAVVRSAGPGTVAFAGNVAGRGVVSVDHPGGLRTTYEPVTPMVVEGAVVEAGAPLGMLLAGHAGCPVEACLHWGLRRGDTYLDPLALLGGGRVRLLPLHAA
jgi:murein DD-endopeptidase MepM/ murein hydrolase activator NlpD